MKKISILFTVAAAMFAGSAMAQSTDSRVSKEEQREEFKDLSVDEKKDVVIAKDREDMAKEKLESKRGDEGNTRQQKKAMLIERYGSKEAAREAMQERKADDSSTEKERVVNHKEEIIEKAGSKEAAKEEIQERRQSDNDNVSKSDVQNHKEQVIERADSEDAAKERLQEKRQDRKEDK